MDQTSVLMHQVMLSDRNRLDAYEQALVEKLTPGDIVADLGAGTLILSWLALKHGAAHVFAIEGNRATAQMAQVIAHHNGISDRVTVVEADARTVALPRQVDVVLGEMMGNLGPEEDMAAIFADFSATNLARGGRTIPESLRTRLVVAELGDEGWGVWNREFRGLDLSVVTAHVRQNAQVHFFATEPRLLSEPADLLSQRLTEPINTGQTAAVTMPCLTDGVANVIVGYFEAQLTESLTLSNFPTRLGSNWGAWIWPLPHTPVTRGDIVEAILHPPADWRDVDTWRLDCRLSRGDS